MNWIFSGYSSIIGGHGILFFFSSAIQIAIGNGYANRGSHKPDKPKPFEVLFCQFIRLRTTSRQEFEKNALCLVYFVTR